MIYGEGISQEGEILSLGETTGVVKKSGSWFSFGEYRLGQGRDNARQFLKENPEVAKEILSAALSQMEVDPVIAFNS